MFINSYVTNDHQQFYSMIIIDITIIIISSLFNTSTIIITAVMVLMIVMGAMRAMAVMAVMNDHQQLLLLSLQ